MSNEVLYRTVFLEFISVDWSITIWVHLCASCHWKYFK